MNFCGTRSRGYGIFSSPVSKRLVLLPWELPLPSRFVSFEAWNVGAMSFQFLSIQKTCRPLMWDVSCHEFVRIVNVFELYAWTRRLWHYQFLDFQKIILLPCGLPVAVPLINFAFCATCGCLWALWALWILWGMISGSYGNFSFWVSKRLFLSCELQVVNGLDSLSFVNFLRHEIKWLWHWLKEWF